MSPKIVIIGSTGKLGSKLLDYTYKNNINISAITCFKNKKNSCQKKNMVFLKNLYSQNQRII